MRMERDGQVHRRQFGVIRCSGWNAAIKPANGRAHGASRANTLGYTCAAIDAAYRLPISNDLDQNDIQTRPREPAGFMTPANRRETLQTLLMLAAILLAGAALYAPALDGGFALDDTANLSGLASVAEGGSAQRFIFAGDAGPLGRPLALASFALQADDWPQGARGFLVVNVGIHLLNAALVAWLALLLARLMPLSSADQRFVALSAAAIWLCMPLLASSSLMVVQRMTTLSATLVLVTLLAYLALRRAHRPGTALIGMTAAVAVGTVLAVFTKESGALLPGYVLVLEATLLTPPAAIGLRHFRYWKMLVLGVPVVALLVYLGTRVPYDQATVLRRGFSGWERLLSEARILWIYLGKAVLPMSGQVSPVNDIYPVARSLWQPLTLIAMLSWSALIAVAVLWRRRYPLAAFAVLWFVVGHLLESTVLPLELYFDHRNYLPVIGPVFAACAGLAGLPARFRRAVRIAVPVYAVFLAGSLYLVTSLWGQPATAAAFWYQKYPDSVRAATQYMSQQLDSAGVDAALRTLRNFVARRPEHAYLLIQDLNIRCRLDPAGDYAQQAGALREQLGDVEFTYTAGSMLSELINAAAATGCTSVGPGTVRALADALRNNPRYQHDARYNALHYKLIALSYRLEGDIDATLQFLNLSADTGNADDATILRIMTMAQARRWNDAAAAIDAARSGGPWHPVRQRFWQNDLDAMERYIAGLQEQTGNPSE